ncbi:hypothetical protein BC826DRAFT_1102789 [Russula brevipes]|nr:hypothetical protein BC826DRAFT_1102789 [Russula brevipes]
MFRRHDYLSRNGCVSLLGYHPPGLTVSAPPSFHPFGVDSRQRDANATRPQPWRRGQSVLALANESMTSRRRHDTCRGTSKPTIVLILTALNHLSSTPSSAFRSAWAALSKILDTVDRLRHMHDPVRYLEWQLNVDPLTLHDFQSRASKISPDLDPSDGTPPTGAGAVHAPECESHQLQLNTGSSIPTFAPRASCLRRIMWPGPAALTPRSPSSFQTRPFKYLMQSHV